MSTVWMKFLETRPADYDRGIQLITLRRIQDIRERIAGFVRPGDRVLEVGCGTGTLALHCAEEGAEVIAIDASAAMLAQARIKAQAAGLGEAIAFQQMDATVIADHFDPASFDLIASALVFSELAEEVQSYVLEACARLLRPTGRLLLADEVVPDGLLAGVTVVPAEPRALLALVPLAGVKRLLALGEAGGVEVEVADVVMEAERDLTCLA